MDGRAGVSRSCSVSPGMAMMSFSRPAWPDTRPATVTFQQLAVGLARQAVAKIDFAARALDRRQLLPAPGDQLIRDFGARRHARLQLHHRAHLLDLVVVRGADHRHVEHLGMGDQHVLGFLRVDVDAAGNNHVALAVGKVKKALLVDLADVAHRGPAVGGVGFAGLVRVLVVAERQGAGEIDQALAAHRHFLAVLADDMQLSVERAADRTRVFGPGGAVGKGHADALGAGVVLVHDGPPPGDHGFLGLHRTRRGCVHRHLLAGQVITPAGLFRQAEQAVKHGRHPLRVRDLVALDRLQCVLGIEFLHQHHGAAEAKGALSTL